MKSRDILRHVADYYSKKLEQHGATPQGVDWRDLPSQHLRFAQFDSLWLGDAESRIADFGCGYGEYLTYLRDRGFVGAYCGVDVSTAMIEAARARFSFDPKATFVLGDSAEGPCDYAIASGIFNVRLNVSIPDWESYIAATIEKMARTARKGIAFNCVTNKVDYRRDDLYYGDPEGWRIKCERLLDVEATLLENYGLYDFTILARKRIVQPG